MAFEQITGLEQILVAISLVSLVAFAVTLAVIPIWIKRMDRDFFIRKKRHTIRNTPFLRRFPIIIMKNITGIVLLAAGFIMLFIPGQGVLTMVMGLTLVNFPFKQQLQIKVLRLKSVQATLNWIRRKTTQTELRFP